MDEHEPDLMKFVNETQSAGVAKRGTRSCLMHNWSSCDLSADICFEQESSLSLMHTEARQGDVLHFGLSARPEFIVETVYE